jgi:mannose-6-phosphate isomerase-like protein (cupin superfamily)
MAKEQLQGIRIIESKLIQSAGNKPKQIAEFIGRLASGDTALSIASMVSPPGWIEPPQTPDFDEFTLVLRGELHIICGSGTVVVRAGQAVRVAKKTRVQYATPDGAEHIAVCLPAFSPDNVHREST